MNLVFQGLDAKVSVAQAFILCPICPCLVSARKKVEAKKEEFVQIQRVETATALPPPSQISLVVRETSTSDRLVSFILHLGLMPLDSMWSVMRGT